jgi:hypothetical protein
MGHVSAMGREIWYVYGLFYPSVYTDAGPLNKGDIIFFKVMGAPMILISSAEVALDLMEKRSAIYSDKPAMTIDDL